MQACFCPAYFEYADEHELFNMLCDLEQSAGKLCDFELAREAYYIMPLSEHAVCVYTGVYQLEFEYTSMQVELELCRQNGEIGINYVHFYPKVH